MNLNIIPTPQSLKPKEGCLQLDRPIRVVLRTDFEEDHFAADYLCSCLSETHQVDCSGASTSESEISLTIGRHEGPAEGYSLTVSESAIEIAGNDAAGVYYATQTLRQCVQGDDQDLHIPCLEIEDAPALECRAMHYDTKHHQDRYEYVESFIRELASYKANILVWEWEDKLAYPSHPQVGAPGAFTTEEMHALTAYAKQHHVEIVPLVQGLGHVAFILKHPEFRHVREIPDSDWEVCPLKDESYELLFDLWKDAMDATPGSRFFHIGSDETYELGLGRECGCAEHAAKHGKDSLMRLFIDRCTDWVESQGRTCLSWGGQWKPEGEPPRPSMIWVDGDDPDYVLASEEAGYPCWVYAPNTGVTPLIDFSLPWLKSSMWHNNSGGHFAGGFARTSDVIRRTAGTVRGSITTSWEDSGLHNQMFMPHFICACEYSWNPEGYELDDWIDRFYTNYFGPQATTMRECQTLLQEGALFYDDILERRVWHWGDIGKVHMPDFPRAGLEYNSFWRKRYGAMIKRAKEQEIGMARAEAILRKNLSNKARHAYDLEVMMSCVKLIQHNIDLVLGLDELERLLAHASYDLHFVDRREALRCLRKMETLLEGLIDDREDVYRSLVSCWEETRLPKGMSAAGRDYFWRPERARHFANRTPDMRYLMMDEDLLGLDDYLERLREYNDDYEENELNR